MQCLCSEIIGNISAALSDGFAADSFSRFSCAQRIRAMAKIDLKTKRLGRENGAGAFSRASGLALYSGRQAGLAEGSGKLSVPLGQALLEAAERRHLPPPDWLASHNGVMQVVLDPYLNAAHVSLLRGEASSPRGMRQTHFISSRRVSEATGPSSVAAASRD